MPMSIPAPRAVSKTVYESQNAEATVTGASTRLPMLPVAALGGAQSFFIPANSMTVGSYILLLGEGTIGARLTTPPGFNFIPWVSTDGGTTKTDLPGFAVAPLLGTDGTCSVLMKIAQTQAGIRISGKVHYGATNGQPYAIQLNTGGTGASGALPTIITSSPSVDRTFGVDGFWGSGADTREYVRCRAVTATLFPVIS